MANCGYCGTTILFGGVRDGPERFCNAKCHQSAALLKIAGDVPPNVLQEHVRAAHTGLCPKCGGSGPVDVHRIYRVWSALIITSWVALPQLSCRSCARQSQVGGIAFSFFLGWWGFPWGIVLTPILITRNIVAMCGGPDPGRPSADLEKYMKTTLALKMVESGQRPRAAGPPPLPPSLPRR